MLNTAFSPWPSYSEEEAEKAKQVLLSNKVNYWTGDQCRSFEREFADFADSQFAIAVSNGTNALELALHGIDIQAGDEVIVPSRTFLATATAVITAGGVPIFADVLSDSGNIDPDSIASLITERTRAIICVHLAGWPCDMDRIMAIAAQQKLFVIEDCAQAHGAKYNGRSVGSIGHVGCWSFCQDKIMTTGGEGGMVTTNEQQLWSTMWSFKDHGKSYDAVYHRQHPPGFRWLHESFGTNYRMTEMQAAIGRIQLKKMSQWTAQRNDNADTIREALQGIEAIEVPAYPTNIVHAQYKLYLYIKPERLSQQWHRDRIVAEINARGVPCYQGSCSEIYLEKCFDDAGLAPAHRLPNTKALGERSLMLLVHPTLTSQEIETTVAALKSVLTEAMG
ncbi:DegT/DnrJ/EryC1/StrS family aminotransferase [Pseudoalteromonas ruthenica]|uniref:Aminotransferase n=1 Tax=Pseudoalteromonas ruthenica TaxID=151081 RepID=A0A0F4PUG9_9GAMM|nr:DegT/DnrJ/EryC1/StrS aminotransferase family protein [Pseudoalteromonas ruthenica]KJY95007.1 aminotransferase [Pseudoalteromonas ruthenica]KJY98688.1 aminotransferase [Pseudoalteromonas ruthenica]TMO93758.1 DegT/DnrJ/EryC1/StrS aminotransferase family protein [Pseudoalteromonas ruthenica]TMP21972.1 DegT/DnrJ/EryC1/StrS aminotransferase family protein [Pseudoalteromonas ruthenica]